MTNEEIARELQGVSITEIATGLLHLGKMMEYVKSEAKSEQHAPLDLPEDTRRKDFGARIKIMRELRGMTQTELARQLGVHKSTLSNWEAGRLEPPQRALIKMAVLLGTSVDWLLDVPTPQPERL